ncbi:hypothetical protein [Micromonospora sp. NPDC023888]|uniref:hypothetical protein n=1 Tax=Micromonospora sp. NPDC023888 TaxID=3155607 RepID=UPI0033DE2FB4
MVIDSMGPLHRVADVLPQADLVADWRRVTGLYRQCVQFAAPRGVRQPPRPLREALAQAMQDVSASYREREEQMCAHGLAVLANNEGHEEIDGALWQRYYRDDRFADLTEAAPAGRPVPTPYEAMVETCRRIRDARSLRLALAGTGTTGLLVGSASYGRFYNVRGRRPVVPASDLDLIIVLRDATALSEVAARLQRIPFASPTDVHRLADRADVFTNRFDDHRTVLSHKVELWGDHAADPVLEIGGVAGRYALSLHLMTMPVLDYVLISSTPRILRDLAGVRRSVRDYRDRPTHRHDHQRTFAGRGWVLRPETVPAAAGQLRTTDIYRIDEFDSYCPGLFQSMLLPAPDLLWGDDLEVLPRLQDFQRKLADRVRYEAAAQRHALLRPSFAHVRREAFAPWVVDRLDSAHGS